MRTRTDDSSSTHDAQSIRSRPSGRQTKVSNLEVTSLGNEDVRRFEVEMNDIVIVEMFDSRCYLGKNLPHSSFVEAFVILSVFFEEVGQVAAGTQLALDEEMSSGFPGIDEGDNVGGAILCR